MTQNTMKALQFLNRFSLIQISLLFTTVLLIGCESTVDNSTPQGTINTLSTTIYENDEIELTAIASDLDGDELSYQWSCDCGQFIGSTTETSVKWVAPDLPNNSETGIIYLLISDGKDDFATNVTLYIYNQ